MILPKELIVLIVSSLPIGELRLGIPVGVYLGLSIEAAAFWGIIGSMLPMFFILKLLGPISDLLMKHSKFFHKFLKNIFEKTRKKHSKKFNDFGAIFLVAFTSIPVPGTGAWTGALIAFLFDVPYRKALLLIFLGVLGSALIMSLGVGTIIEIPSLLKLFIKPT